MSPFVSRVVVAALLLPLILLVIWAGGWWVSGWRPSQRSWAARVLRDDARAPPGRPRGLAGTLAALVGAEWGPEWALAAS